MPSRSTTSPNPTDTASIAARNGPAQGSAIGPNIAPYTKACPYGLRTIGTPRPGSRLNGFFPAISSTPRVMRTASTIGTRNDATRPIGTETTTSTAPTTIIVVRRPARTSSPSRPVARRPARDPAFAER